ncbi:helix-turn-helix domain-containing protein [Nocardia sp. alder85J]|uniref:helix-turn-helix domain-containing protein n=1 Tax=Nocardia sp. alder85J TaxID=2862949 RepID=UPI001CD59DD5|nr:helix-turn-helix transcriptional regulator [Nocardia sp. alder85J]MCX4096534.1 helix-turn-helix transcriptional regulator [Nocardia sp. alder85J]
MDVDRAIGKRIEARRIHREWSQEELSKRLREVGVNWSQVTLSKVEKGQRPVKLAETLPVSTVLGIEPLALVPGWGGLATLRARADQNLQQAMHRVHQTTSILNHARHELKGIRAKAELFHLCCELEEGRRGPRQYVVNCRNEKEFLELLDGTVQEFDRVDAGERDWLDLMEELGIGRSRIRNARAQISGDLNDANDQVTYRRAWEVPPYAIDIPRDTEWGEHLLQPPELEPILNNGRLQRALTCGMALSLFRREFGETIVFRAGDTKWFRAGDEEPLMVRGLKGDRSHPRSHHKPDTTADDTDETYPGKNGNG